MSHWKPSPASAPFPDFATDAEAEERLSPLVRRGLAAAERDAGLHGRRHTAHSGGDVTYDEGVDPDPRYDPPIRAAFRTPRDVRPNNVPLVHPPDRDDPWPVPKEPRERNTGDLEALLTKLGIVL